MALFPFCSWLLHLLTDTAQKHLVTHHANAQDTGSWPSRPFGIKDTEGVPVSKGFPLKNAAARSVSLHTHSVRSTGPLLNAGWP